MNKLISIVGASGVGKTTLVRALAQSDQFATAYEEHAERPFQSLFKQDRQFALANQMDYLLLRAEQEKKLRTENKYGLMDGGLDLDFHGFTRLFRHRGLLTDPEFDLCRRFYLHTRELQPAPEYVVALYAAPDTISDRLASRARINIASAEDADLMEKFIAEWLDSLPQGKILSLDITEEKEDYSKSVKTILQFCASSE